MILLISIKVIYIAIHKIELIHASNIAFVNVIVFIKYNLQQNNWHGNSLLKYILLYKFEIEMCIKKTVYMYKYFKNFLVII